MQVYNDHKISQIMKLSFSFLEEDFFSTVNTFKISNLLLLVNMFEEIIVCLLTATKWRFFN